MSNQTLRVICQPRLFSLIRVGAVLTDPLIPGYGDVVARIDTNGALMESGQYLIAARINQLSMAMNGPEDAA